MVSACQFRNYHCGKQRLLPLSSSDLLQASGLADGTLKLVCSLA